MSVAASDRTHDPPAYEADALSTRPPLLSNVFGSTENISNKKNVLIARILLVFQIILYIIFFNVVENSELLGTGFGVYIYSGCYMLNHDDYKLRFSILSVSVRSKHK